MTQTVLQKAVAAEPFNGNQSTFARAIGTTQQNISNWVRLSKQLPAELCSAAERETGIPKHIWRPDIFEQESAAA